MSIGRSACGGVGSDSFVVVEGRCVVVGVAAIPVATSPITEDLGVGTTLDGGDRIDAEAWEEVPPWAMSSAAGDVGMRVAWVAASVGKGRGARASATGVAGRAAWSSADVLGEEARSPRP